MYMCVYTPRQQVCIYLCRSHYLGVGQEQPRNEERGRLDIRDGHLLDPRNRDPNFLSTDELARGAERKVICASV